MSSLLLAGMCAVPSEFIAKVRAYIAMLSSLHNELFLIPSKHIKQVKKEKKRHLCRSFCRSKASDTEYLFKRVKREPGHTVSRNHLLV